MIAFKEKEGRVCVVELQHHSRCPKLMLDNELFSSLRKDLQDRADKSVIKLKKLWRKLIIRSVNYPNLLA